MCFLSLFHFLLKKNRSSSFLLLLSWGGSWSILLEVGVGPSQLGLALPSQGWGWSFLFGPFFSLHLSMFLQSLTQAGQSAPHQRMTRGIQHNPKGKDGEGQAPSQKGRGGRGEGPATKGRGTRPDPRVKEGKIGVSRSRLGGRIRRPGPAKTKKEGQADPKRREGEGQDLPPPKRGGEGEARPFWEGKPGPTQE